LQLTLKKMVTVLCLLFQRYEELSEKWDAAKRGVRQEDHELLREKVALQQELIRRQDEYADQKRQHHADQENKVGGGCSEGSTNQIATISLLVQAG